MTHPYIGGQRTDSSLNETLHTGSNTQRFRVSPACPVLVETIVSRTAGIWIGTWLKATWTASVVRLTRLVCMFTVTAAG